MNNENQSKNNLFINERQYKRNVSDIKKMIKGVTNANKTILSDKPDLTLLNNFSKKYNIFFEEDILKYSLDLMRLIEKTTYDNSMERGSCWNPIFNGNWSAGSFGSMWCDINFIDGIQIRITLKNNSEKKAISFHRY